MHDYKDFYALTYQKEKKVIGLKRILVSRWWQATKSSEIQSLSLKKVAAHSTTIRT